MGFMSALTGFGKGAIGGFIGSGFNPYGALAGGAMGAIGGASKGKKKKAPAGAAVDPMMTPDITGDRSRFLSLLSGGKDAVAETSRVAAARALPVFKDELQGIRESSNRRGISNGETAVGYEDRASSDFQNHLADSIASHSMDLYGAQLGGARDLYGTDLDVRAGTLDRATAADNARRQSKSSLWGSILGAGATAAGAYFGNRGAKKRDPGYAGNA